MTVWRLKCEVCGSEREINVGFNLYEFKRVYIYCRNCKSNTLHVVLGHKE
ncbi:MAG: hypothetical protein ACO2OQ_02845 [Thermofilaceae archaeon]|jgi:ribosomal protein L44E|nr:hypothetical protein [Thermofilum sp.]MCC6059577.1 hypothetical protein [Thermofilum sp.]